jgi:hypothetical protein
MSKTMVNQTTESRNADVQWQVLATTSGIVALIQLACVLITIVVTATVGVEPSSPQGYFGMFQENRLQALLRLDFPTMIQLALWPITIMGIYALFRRTHAAYAALTGVLVLVGVTVALAAHSGFSIIRISDQYVLATTEAQKAQLAASAEAVISTDMWHSSAGFLAGLFMQGGLAFISVVGLRSGHLSKGTAITGLVANGLDWLHVLVALVSPSLATTLLYVAGPAYLLWFPLLGRDLIKYGRQARTQEPVATGLLHQAQST